MINSERASSEDGAIEFVVDPVGDSVDDVAIELCNVISSIGGGGVIVICGAGDGGGTEIPPPAVPPPTPTMGATHVVTGSVGLELPKLFAALTSKSYDCPPDKPPIEALVCAVLAASVNDEAPETLSYTKYCVTGTPPLKLGATQETLTALLAPDAVTDRGTYGTNAGCTLLDGLDEALSPAALAAITVNVYVVVPSFVRPVIV